MIQDILWSQAEENARFHLGQLAEKVRFCPRASSRQTFAEPGGLSERSKLGEHSGNVHVEKCVRGAEDEARKVLISTAACN